MPEFSITLSALDEQRFGIRTARATNVTAADLTTVASFCREQAVQLLIVRVAVQELAAVQQLEAAGARLMDTLLAYAFKYQRKSLPDRDERYLLRPATSDDRAALRALAAQSFAGYYGHYHVDPRLDNALADAVYEDWAVKSVELDTMADEVLVLDGSDGLLGFATLRMNTPQEGEGVLYGVAPAAQGQGIYRAMIVEGLHWVQAREATQMIVSTQITNVAVQKVWARVGYEFDHAYYTLHQWFDE